MRIRVKLMGVLKDLTPPDGTLELADGATIDDALAALEISPESVQVFTVNGKLNRDRGQVLEADDEFSVIPPVGGG